MTTDAFPMTMTKAEIKFFDAMGRVVVLTTENIAAVIYPTQFEKTAQGVSYAVGDRFVLVRREKERRMTDWRVISIIPKGEEIRE